MRRPIVPVFHALVAAGCLGLLACGGDSGGTGPRPGGGSPAGSYALRAINDARPGQTVLLSNPDGGAIGLYQFDGNSDLRITEQHTYRLVLRFADEKSAYEYDDQGTVSGVDDADGGRILTFESDSYGGSFMGRYTEDGVTTMQYDVDGDGEADTSLGFSRVN